MPPSDVDVRCDGVERERAVPVKLEVADLRERLKTAVFAIKSSQSETRTMTGGATKYLPKLSSIVTNISIAQMTKAQPPPNPSTPYIRRLEDPGSIPADCDLLFFLTLY